MTKCATSRVVARMLGGVAFTAMALSGGAAFAQTAQGEQVQDAIVVIGVTKQATLLQETPIAITALSGDQLETQGVRQVGEIANFTPGFNIRGAGNNPTAIILAMRGQVQGDNIASLEPSVGTYIDDVYVARSYGLNVDMLDISDVQVLKGPQGTLFGRNTSAGALVIRTNDPVFDEISGSVKATYGRFNEWNTTGIINLGLSDTVAIRGAVSYGERDSFATDIITGRKYQGTETLNARVKLAWKPSDTLTVTLSGEWYDGKVEGPPRQGLALFLNPFLFGPSPEAQAQVAALQGIADAQLAAFAGNPDLLSISQPAAHPGAPEKGLFNDTTTQTYIARAELETDFGQLKWITGYRRVKSDNIIDLDGFVLPIHMTAGTQDLKQFSTELQLTGAAMDDRLSYAAGVTYLTESGTDQSRTNILSNPVWSRFLGEIDNDSIGAYVQASYNITEALRVTGGVRYSIDDKGITVYNGNVMGYDGPLVSCSPASVSVANDCARSRKDSWNNLSYTIGLDYKITDDVMVYAKQSRGFRAGAQQLRSLTLEDSAPAEPEIVNEQEIGLKTSTWDNRVQFNIAGFHNTVADAQRSVILAVGGVSQTVLENADMENWGVEADVNIRVAPGLNLFASGSLVDSKHTKYDGFSVLNGVLVPEDKTDARIGAIAEKQFLVGMNYEGNVGFGTLKANVTYSWQSDINQDGNTIERYTRPLTEAGGLGFTQAQAETLLDVTTTKAHGIANARLGLAFGPEENYEIAIWGRNVFNVRRPNYTLFLNGLNYVGTSWNDPATYGVTISARF
ncbi:TonB-dependent receptor [Sandaracinobacteroides sp. A072]|uniref:TonB-dependent receptor n=1 Tax=Sandaracinobacteroides sp. A072 TaxID=3461146 RepID=UPI0040421325